jgi:hypothetical protein
MVVAEFVITGLVSQEILEKVVNTIQANVKLINPDGEYCFEGWEIKARKLD